MRSESPFLKQHELQMAEVRCSSQACKRQRRWRNCGACPATTSAGTEDGRSGVIQAPLVGPRASYWQARRLPKCYGLGREKEGK